MTKTKNSASKSSASKKEGWKIIHLYGTAFERGVKYGEISRSDLDEALQIIEVYCKNTVGKSWKHFVDLAATKYMPNVRDAYPEIYDEIRGIAAGSGRTVEEIIAWNGYISLISPADLLRCSAFIATGNYTSDGNIVMAHNTHDLYITEQNQNYIVYMYPTEGYSFVIQSFPGGVWSMSDFFVSSSGIVGTETTIAGHNARENPGGHPIFCRIRHCIQFCGTVEEYIARLSDNNGGDYACSWLLGNVDDGEIAKIELGSTGLSVECKNNGYFVGANQVEDRWIREKETAGNLSESVVSRKARLEELMEKHAGAINHTVAKKIIADHYDMKKGRVNPGPNSICKHSELGGGKELKGAVDGKVCTGESAKRLGNWARWGSSCGTPFSVNKTKRRRHYPAWQTRFLKDRPGKKWIFVCSQV